MKKLNQIFIFLLCLPFFLSAQTLDMENFKGMTARNIGPAGMSGRVTAIDVVNANPETMYIGGASGGLWRSENGGYSWAPVFENENAVSVGAVAINQNNPNEIWIGTGEGNPRNSVSSGYGIYKTMDRGKTWKLMGLEKTRNIHRVIIHPNDPNTVIVGAIGSPWGPHSERGIYKTTDGGESWSQTLFVNESTGVGDLVVDPSNPNKLIVAMWEHRRYPWKMQSGGKGSGLHISYDGGDTWKEITTENGLPKGDLGRIGLSFAPSQPNIVYALIEAKKNGLYKSTDGGETWKLVSTKGIGGRPFYYADIFVDTKNENRIFNLHTFTDVSQDGGKTFERFIPSSLIHVDNHAWWQHPDNPDLMMCGNDGGLCISRDAGKTWYFPESLPLGQFYHIRTDMAVPYNVYGGMQDNGSWRGPSQVWRRKGIRNLYWNRIGYGDGFDAVPDPLDERYGYSNLQGGRLLRYDLETGNIQSLRPFVQNDVPLRFNWNAAIAIDPFDQKTIYYGSQYVLRSTDKGQTWEKISSDLTTNNSEKQVLETGGLTLDVTGAEYHTTIITIAPSPKEQGVIWVGTDDGNIQITRDGGASWTNVTNKLKDVPAGSWIAQIQPSPHQAGEAFAVINNYRRNDWKPYLYRTTDYGKSWTKMVDENQVWGYCLSVAQDPIAPNLLFLGTEFGLYVSIDDGKNWTKWTSGYPTVSTMDMDIHPREHDLVLGTFGRAIWILDDIRPLRELAQKGKEAVFNKDFHLFPIPDAYLANLGEPNGYRSTGHDFFVGKNREQGALLSFYIKKIKEVEDEKKAEKVKVEIFDDENNLLRTLKHKPHSGINRMTWKLDKKGIRFPNQPKPKREKEEPEGRNIVPGTYTVKMTYDGKESTAKVLVKADPKVPTTLAQMKEKAQMIDRHYENIATMTDQIDALHEASQSIDNVKKHIKEMKETDALKELIASGDSIQSQIKTLIGLVNPPKDLQGIYRNPELISNQLMDVSRHLQDVLFAPSPTQQSMLEEVEQNLKPVLEKIKAFREGEWQNYKKAVKKAELEWIR